ncbi:MAG: peptidoglycan DD-metalloendopeptidase family protein [Bacteroidota bacterium]
MKNLIINMLMLSMFSLCFNEVNGQVEEIQFLKDEIVRKETQIGLANNYKDDFLPGVKSPYEDYIWYYSSRNTIKSPTDFYKYNSKTGESTILFNASETPVKEWSLTPFAFGKDPNIIYLEAFDYAGGDGYHLGVWSYHLSSKAFVPINIDEMYMGTPVIDKSRSNFYYPATSEDFRDIAHSNGDIYFQYQIETKLNTLLDPDIKLVEINSEGLLKQAQNCLPARQTHIAYQFPYAGGSSYCIGRLGSTPPCPNGIPNTCQGVECPHGHDPVGGGCTPPSDNSLYIAMDVTDGTINNNIYAAAYGEVKRAEWISGYGNSIEILHNDDYYTFYAHLDEMLVSVGDFVTIATVIGTEGETGRVTGEHLHFEYRSTYGVKGTDYIEFREFNNQVPNYGNSGTVLPKPPVPVFVSNLDLTPLCDAMAVSNNTNLVFINGLRVDNIGDALAGPFTVYYSLINSGNDIEIGNQRFTGLDAFSSLFVSPIALDISAIPVGNYQLEVYVETDDFANNPNPLAEYDLTNNDCLASDIVNVTGGPTCFDGIQNQGETGVDCGGPCLPCNVPTCWYTFFNDTNCEIEVLWHSGSTFESVIVPPYGASNRLVEDGEDAWTAYDTYTGLLLTPSWTTAFCSSPSGSLPSTACSDNTCNFTFSNNTDCEVHVFIQGNDGFLRSGPILPPFGSAVELVRDGESWIAYRTSTAAIVQPWTNISCSNPSGIIPASACADACDFTINNNTDCEIEIHWTDNNGGFWVGAIIPPFGSAVESIDDGDAWAAYNNTDGSLITPSYQLAICSSPSATLAASACSNASSSCDPDGDFSGNYSGTTLHHAENFITSPGGGATCVIQTSADVTLKAGNYILLKPGFHAKDNCSFLAQIEDCNTILPVQVNNDNHSTDDVHQSDVVSIRNFPNPFNQSTTIEYKIPSDTNVRIRVFNASMQEVQILVDNELQSAGKHTVEFKGDKHLPGMYFYSIQAGDYKQTQKMI